MPANVFVSFDHEDQQQVEGFRGLINNPNHPLDFHDHSLKNPVVGQTGKPITYSPYNPKSRPVRREILRKFEKASRMVVLIGKSTHKSDWVKWEIVTFYENKKRLPGKTRKRIRAMWLLNCENTSLPNVLKGRSIQPMRWDPIGLDKWLEENPTAQ